jgi:hypothetical protein
MSRVSVVIPTRGRPDLIGRSVRAVLANDHADFDVVVVDQSDDDRTVRSCGRWRKAIAGFDTSTRCRPAYRVRTTSVSG